MSLAPASRIAFSSSGWGGAGEQSNYRLGLQAYHHNGLNTEIDRLSHSGGQRRSEKGFGGLLHSEILKKSNTGQEMYRKY